MKCVECEKELHEGDAVLCRDCHIVWNRFSFKLQAENAKLRQQRDEALEVAKHLLGALMCVRSTYGARYPEDAEIWLRTINGAENRIAYIERDQKPREANSTEEKTP